MGYIEDLRKVIGNQHHVKLQNGDEIYPVTVAYITKEILGGDLKADGVETTEARYFSLSELPDQLNPLIKNLMKQFALTFERSSYAEKCKA